MLSAHLSNQGFQCIRFNAWEVDYTADPLVAMVSAIDQLPIPDRRENTFKEHMKQVRRVTSLVAKRGTVAAVKALTVGAIDLEDAAEAAIAEFAGETVGDVVDAFQRESQLIVNFRSELEKGVKQLQSAGKRNTLVFIIDELDRCRPTFAIELLERIKHLFSVVNIVFVLAIDREQLEASVGAVYGEKINATEYLRRFIDIDFAIPAPDGVRYTRALFERFELDDLFAQRTHPELRGDKDSFSRFFTALADVYQLTLRARERCFTRLRIVMELTPTNHYLDPALVALLIVVRAKRHGLFKDLVNDRIPPDSFVNELEGLPGGRDLLNDQTGRVLEAYLINADVDRQRRARRLAHLKKQSTEASATAEERARASRLCELCEHLPGPLREPISLSVIGKKIDLAADIKTWPERDDGEVG
jgi:hypothetical protein